MITNMNPEHAANHIVLLVDNTQNYYNQKMMIFNNLEKKVRKGTYDKTKAPKAISYLTDVVRKNWNKEYSADQEEVMTPSGSRMADKELVHDFEVEYLQYEKRINIKGGALKNTVKTGRF